MRGATQEPRHGRMSSFLAQHLLLPSDLKSDVLVVFSKHRWEN
jgi:hypothetical protein